MVLEASDRYALVQALAKFMAPLPKSEVDAILTTAQSSSGVPGWWDNESQNFKLDRMRQRLAAEPDEVLIGLMGFLPKGEQIAIPVEPAVDSLPGSIFVVHGHAHASLHETARVLERATDRKVIILREQPNAGRMILEKFEDYAASVSFAVVLLTGDDQGGVRGSDDVRLRARQNVIFELGFFFGKLGRDKLGHRRVAALLEEGVEKPSDRGGLAYIDLDQAGAWKQELARELEAAGISVDRSQIP